MNELFGSLTGLLTEFGDRPEVREAVVFAAWRKIAVHEQTAPVALDDQRLIVAVKDGTWKDHLEALSGQMIFKLNSALRDSLVTFIEFRVDEKLVDENSRKYRESKTDPEESARIAREEITPKLRHSAEAIKDDDLREHFLLAAGRCLARKKTLAERG
jgi:hypothetical protein